MPKKVEKKVAKAKAKTAAQRVAASRKAAKAKGNGACRSTVLRAMIVAVYGIAKGVTLELSGKAGEWKVPALPEFEVLASYTGAGDFKLENRTKAAVMHSARNAKGKACPLVLISPSLPGGKYLFEGEQVHAENREKVRPDAVIDAVAQAVVDLVIGAKPSADDKAGRTLWGKRRKALIEGLRLAPARFRADKDGGVTCDLKKFSAYGQKCAIRPKGHKLEGKRYAVSVPSKPTLAAVKAWEAMENVGVYPHGVADKAANVSKSDGGRSEPCGCFECGAKANLAKVDVGLLGCITPGCTRGADRQPLLPIGGMIDAERKAFLSARAMLQASAA